METNSDFVDGFARFWKDPSPERLGDYLHPDAHLIQPLAPPMHGLVAAQQEFARIFSWLPDLHGIVDRWSRVDDVVFIEFRMNARMGHELVEWPAIDRFRLRDGKAVERVSYFDSFPLVIKVLRHPSTWVGWLRSGTARPWGARVAISTVGRA